MPAKAARLQGTGLGVALVTALFPGFALWAQWLLFSILGAVTVLLFRRPLLEHFRHAWPGKPVGCWPSTISFPYRAPTRIAAFSP